MGKSLKKQRYINLFIKTKVAFPKKTRPAQELAKALIISAGTLNVTKISYEANQSGERKSSSPNIQISRRSLTLHYTRKNYQYNIHIQILLPMLG